MPAGEDSATYGLNNSEDITSLKKSGCGTLQVSRELDEN